MVRKFLKVWMALTSVDPSAFLEDGRADINPNEDGVIHGSPPDLPEHTANFQLENMEGVSG